MVRPDRGVERAGEDDGVSWRIGTKEWDAGELMYVWNAVHDG